MEFHNKAVVGLSSIDSLGNHTLIYTLPYRRENYRYAAFWT